MADSGYYYNLYRQKRSAVNSYEGDIKDINKALSNLTDKMYDEIRAINNELDDLKEDLKKAVRHNAKFTSRANAFGTEKEKTVTADPFLSVAVRELQEEISRLTSLKNQAVQDRDYYYRKYKEKKEEERKEFFDKIF